MCLVFGVEEDLNKFLFFGDVKLGLVNFVFLMCVEWGINYGDYVDKFVWCGWVVNYFGV